MADLQINKTGEASFEGGYISSGPKAIGTNYMAAGSENMTLTGAGKTLAFKDVALRDEEGGQVMMNIVENFASIGDESEDEGYGNVFNVFSALFYIGAGLVKLAGVSLLVVASSTLSLLIKRNGVYTDPLSGPFQAGLLPPSAPIIRAITPPAGYEGKVNGVVSVVIWRIRSTTGAVSNRSEVSNIVGATNQSVAVKLPLKDSNGQDYWGIGVTKQAEGRVGSHFEYTEIAESSVVGTLTRTDFVTDSADLDITSATGGFTSTHIGWSVTLSGGTPSCSLTSYVTAVPDGNTLTLADMPPTTSTGVIGVLTQAIEGEARTVVIEWRDGDLAGKPFAPSRSFPPPAGLFASTQEDIVYVDGAYADAVASVSTDVRGSAIAPSEFGKPESYSPARVIFTNDTPTGLLKGDGIDWRLCKNSVYVIRYLGGDTPLSVEQAWHGVGVQYQTNAVLGEGGRLYVWADGRGALRMGADGLPDSTFANDIADDLMPLTDPLKRVLGWDGRNQVVCYIYEKRCWTWSSTLNRWWSPCTLDIEGNARSCVTVDNLLYISDTEDNLYEFNTGTGSVAKVMTGWMQSQGAYDTISSVIANVRADNLSTITIDVYADGDDSAPAETMSLTPTRTGYQRLLPIRPNIQDTTSHAVKITITSNGGDCGVERIETYGDGNSII